MTAKVNRNLKAGDIVRVVGSSGTARIRSILNDRHAAFLDKKVAGFRLWNLDELRLVKRGKNISKRKGFK